MISEHIFRMGSIRGAYGTDLNEEIFEQFGNVFAQMVKNNVLVAYDVRKSSPSLTDAFVRGARSAGATVVSIGLAPQCCAVFYAQKHEYNLAYITASHIAGDWNGIKFFHKNGTTYKDKDMALLKKAMKGKMLTTGKGHFTRVDTKKVIREYVDEIAAKVKFHKAKTKVLIDCGNGVNGLVAKQLFEKAGFHTDVIFAEPDGSFPNRHPDPKEDPLNELKKRISGYDIGIAYDADGDRAIFLTKRGIRVSIEQEAGIILSALPKGPVVANVECTNIMNDIAKKQKRELYWVKVGQVYMEEKLLEKKAVLGIESSYHIFLPAMTKFADAVAASLFVAGVVEKTGKSLDDFVGETPVYPTRAKKFLCPDRKKFNVIEKIKQDFRKKYRELNELDGVKILLENGSVLIRASQTEPAIRITVEGKTMKDVDKLEKEFAEVLEKEINRKFK
ncbi:MAG: hypothetical protein NT120_00715 [Candidatus Aenigmarchaeota archaeon]|nr:hypothetical protein [Candidatus Aenigmarchaeota archaeon]